jgi:restriction system protein
MAVPTFQEIMLPYLQILGDGQAHRHAEIMVQLATYFGLTDEDLRELLPSGRQSRFTNRAGWARTYLTKAGLVEPIVRGTHRITQDGLDLLQQNPSHIDMKLLERFPKYVEFRNKTNQAEEPIEIASENEREVTGTPEETLELSFQRLNQSLAEDILEYVKSCSYTFFERLVIDLLLAMGYGGNRRDAGQAIGQSGDGGVDGIIKEDRLGLDAIYIQAKRWEGSIGRPELQRFAGALEGVRARKGVFITTSYFTKDAIDYVSRTEKKIVLIDGEQLAQLMIDFGVGVAERATYVVKRIDEDYFTE